MLEFIVVETLEVLDEAQVRERFKRRTSLPTVLNAQTQEFLGIAPITPAPKPSIGEDQVLVRGEVTQDVLGNYIRQWVIVDRYASEMDQIASEQQALADRFVRMQQEITEKTMARLDAFAQTRGYFSMLSLASYATTPDETWRAEAQHIIVLREATLKALYAIESAVLAGERPIPATFEEIESELPPLVWPN